MPKLVWLALFSTVFLTVACFGQSIPEDSLCTLQLKVSQGTHMDVRVAGVFNEGFDVGTLEDAACTETTWVELSLQNKKNRKKLATTLDRSRNSQAFVVFEGELYGPPLPDPNLPEAIRNSYHPNWGHSNCCRTKLVVRAILAVGPVSIAPENRPEAQPN